MNKVGHETSKIAKLASGAMLLVAAMVMAPPAEALDIVVVEAEIGRASCRERVYDDV